MLEVRHDPVNLQPTHRVTGQFPFRMDQVARFVIQTFTAFDIQVAVAQQALVQGQHQHAPQQGSPDGSEAGRRDLLENGHEKTERSPLVTLPAGQVEAVF